MGSLTMSVVNDAAAAPKAAVSFAKSRPLAFAVLALVVILLTLRYVGTVAQFLVRIPVIGSLFAKVARIPAPAKKAA